MSPAETIERDGSRPNPPVFGSLAYLVLNLPIGIAGFVFVITGLAVGIGTAIIWIGVGVLAVTMLVWRGAAQLERQRVSAMLRTYVATPYRPAETQRWRSRATDPATWKDMAYWILLLPIGIAEFTIMVVFWSVSLWLVCLPALYTWTPPEWHPEWWGYPLFGVDSVLGTLPWVAVGVVLFGVTVLLTKGLGTLHARYARAMLGPSPSAISRLEDRLSTAGVIDWDPPRAGDSTATSYGPVSR